MSKMDWMDDLRAAESGDPYFATPKGDLRRCVAERKALRRIEELEAEITFQVQCKVANRREAERLEAENGRLEAELAQERKDFREAWASYKRLREDRDLWHRRAQARQDHINQIKRENDLIYHGGKAKEGE